MRAYTDLALAGRFDEAAKVSSGLDRLREVSHRWIMGRWRETGVIPIAAIKEWSALLGMAAGPVRTPLLQMSEGERAAIRSDIEATGILTGEPVAEIA
jgi:4-hydroxy-tetrahydrodipicolinate synthase